MPAFEDQSIEREFLAWDHEGNSAIRAGDWKLVRQGERSAWELYDLARDRTEIHDLASEHPERVREMAVKWEEWARRCWVFPKPGERQ